MLNSALRSTKAHLPFARNEWERVAEIRVGRATELYETVPCPTFTSLLASAQLCKIEPWAYLRDLFCLLSNWPAHQMLDLAPLNWAQTSARKDVRALLAANKFRDLTIDAG